ncbi:MAG: cytochrome c maturation protein CcmE [candidate division WOR-3 bacterium]
MKKLKYIFIILALMLAIAYSVYAGVNKSAVYYYTVTELYQKPIKSQNVKVSGIVKEKSVIKNMNNVEFLIYQGDKEVKVVYKGILPDAFSENNEVIVEGKYDKENKIIYAKTILTKCPSRYEKLNN